MRNGQLICVQDNVGVQWYDFRYFRYKLPDNDSWVPNAGAGW